MDVVLFWFMVSTLKGLLIMKLIMASILTLSFISLVQAELYMGAVPSGNVDEDRALYQPIANAISTALGEKVNLEISKNWLVYSKKVILDRYDLVFSEAHVAAWLMRESMGGGGLAHEPLISFEGQHKVGLFVREDSEVTALEELERARLCSSPSPGVDAIQLYKLYPNPVIQPNIREVRGGYKKIAKLLKEGRCDAGVLKVSDEKLVDGLRLIRSLMPVPKAMLTVSSRQSREKFAVIKATLTDPKKQGEWRPLLEHYGSAAFEVADENRYAGFDDMLDMSWYW